MKKVIPILILCMFTLVTLVYALTWGVEYTYDNFSDDSIDTSLWTNNSADYVCGGEENINWVNESGGMLIAHTEVCGTGGAGNRVESVGTSTNMPTLSHIENITIRGISDNVITFGSGCAAGSYAKLNVLGNTIFNLISDDDSIWTFLRNESAGVNKFDVFNDSVFDKQITASDNVVEIRTQCVGEGTGATGYMEAKMDYVYYTYSNLTNVTLNTPLNNSKNYNQQNITFNATGYTSINNLVNMTLYINGILNETKIISGASNTTTFSKDLSSLNLGTHNWSIQVCDDGVNCDYSVTNYFTLEPLKENSQIYNTTTTETSSESFIINMTYNSTKFTSTSATLYYNGTAYTGTKSGTGDTILYSKQLYMPSVSATTNKSFYWTIGLYNGTWNYYNSTSYNQTIQDITAMSIASGNCPAGLTKVMNFTFANEMNLTSLENVNIKYNFRYGVSNSTGSDTYGNINATELSVCLNTTQSSEYTIGYGEIEYDLSGYTSRRFYVFDGTRVSNVTTYNTLYLLPDGDSTSFLIEIREPTLTPYVGKYTSLLRWYPNLNEYKIVEMGKTDDKGQTVKKVKVEDVDYRVGVYDTDGTLIYLASPIRMVCIASPCSYTLTVRETTSYAFDDIQNIQADITYSSGIFTLIYNDPSQNTQLMELKVYRIGGTASDTLICSTNGTSYTGILTCDVSAYDGILKAVAIRSASPSYPIASLIVDTITTVFQGTFGLFLQFLISATLIFLGIISPVVAIILGILSLLFGVLLFKTITYPIFIGIAIVGGIIIHFMKESGK